MTSHCQRSETLLQCPQGLILSHPQFATSACAEWFQPHWWGGAARPVSSGGRGTAWFVSRGAENWVLRHYSRGGLMARLSKRTYGFAGIGRVRSFAEFRLLQQLIQSGLPVPEPIAAWYQRSCLVGYRAGIIVRTITGSQPFADYLTDDNPDLWCQVGALVRRFHDAGVDHADLNCHNILVTPGQLYLIDFDKGRVRGNNHPAAPWKKRNLQRLYRSMEKLLGYPPAPESWRRLIAHYERQPVARESSTLS